MSTTPPPGFDQTIPIPGTGSTEPPPGFTEQLNQTPGAKGWIAPGPQQIADRALAQTGLPPAAPPAAPPTPQPVGILSGQTDAEARTAYDARLKTALANRPRVPGPEIGQRFNLETPPEGMEKFVSGAGGYPKIVEGAKTTIRNFRPPMSVTPESREGVLSGINEMTKGAMEAATPAVIAGGLLNPTATAVSLAGAGAGGYAAKKVAEKAGASPVTQEFVGNIGALAGGFAGGMGAAKLTSVLFGPGDGMVTGPEAARNNPEVQQHLDTFRSTLKSVGIDLPEDATLDQARTAYKQAVTKLHPDINPDADQDALRDLTTSWAGIRDAAFRRTGGATAGSSEPPAGFTEEVPVKGAPARPPAETTPRPSETPNAPAPQEAQGTPSEIAARAKEQQPQVVAAAQGIADQVPGAKVVDPGAKPAESIARKLDSDREVTDASRAQVVVKNQDDKGATIEAIKAQLPVTEVAPIKAENLPIVAAKLPNAGEIQVATEQEHKAQAETHPIYQAQQEALARGDKAEADRLGEELKAKQKELTQPVSNPSQKATSVEEKVQPSTQSIRQTATEQPQAPSILGEPAAPPSGTTALKKGAQVTVDGKPGTLTYLSKLPFEKSRVKLDAGGEVAVPHREVGKRIFAFTKTPESIPTVNKSGETQTVPSAGAGAPKEGGGAPKKNLTDLVNEALANAPTKSPADKLRSEADALAKKAMAMVERIPAGQPVRTAADRTLREKSGELMSKAAALHRQADELEAAAPVQGVTSGTPQQPTPKPGAPIQPMMDLVRDVQARGIKPVVFTTEVEPGAGAQRKADAEAWVKKHLGDIPITATKIDNELILDDHANVEPNTGKLTPDAQKRVDALKAGDVLLIDLDKTLRAEKPNGAEIARPSAVQPNKEGTNDRTPETVAPKGEPVKTQEKPFKYGSTQANIPHGSDASNAIIQARNRISDGDLAGKGKDVGGEHVTVRYGIKSDDTADVKKYLSSLQPFEASLGKTSSFPPSEHSDGAAVIIAPITSPELEKINSEIEKHGDFTVPSFKEYAPHATIAYVKPEAASRYTGMSITNGQTFRVDEIAITNREGTQEVVPLKGAVNAVQEQGPAGILQRQPQEVGEARGGRGRVEPGEQGQVSAGSGGEAAVGGATGVQGTQEKGVGTPEYEALRKRLAALEKKVSKPVEKAVTAKELREKLAKPDKLAEMDALIKKMKSQGFQEFYEPLIELRARREIVAEGKPDPGPTAIKKIITDSKVSTPALGGGLPSPTPPAPVRGAATSFKRAEPPQVAQPLKVKSGVTFESRRGDGTKEQLRGTEYYIPGYEEYRIATVPPRGNKAEHNKQGWSTYEITTGRRIYEFTPPPGTEQQALAQTRRMFETIGKDKIDAAIQHHMEQPSAPPTVRVPTTEEYEAIKAREAAGSSPEAQRAYREKVKAAAAPPAAEAAPAPRLDLSKQEQAFPKSVSAPGTYGGDTVVKTPNGDVAAKYKIVEAANLLPSHDAETFAKNPSYPEGVQERAYHSSKEAQARVTEQTQKYDPAYTVNTNPDAVNGPPVVTKSGVVLGGNSRAMATQRMYRRGGGDAYKNAIAQQAASFGLDPAAVKDFSRPVLVREIPNPATLEEARRLGSDLNKNMTGALGVAEKAVSAGKSITPETLQRIAGMIDEMGGDASIRDVLRDKGRDIIPMLEKDGLITARERPAFIDTATGGLSEEGKTFVERALRGLIVDDPTLMERAPKSILNKLDGSLADIVGLAQRTDEYNLLPLLREAIAEHADIAARGSDVDTHLAQTGMFGPERNPAVDAVIRLLADKSKTVKNALRQFAQDANFDKQGQAMLMVGEQPSPTKAFNDAFGTNFTEDEYQKSVIDTVEKQLQNRTGATDVGSPQEEARGTAGEVQPQQAQAASEVNPRHPTTGAAETLAKGESGAFTPKAVLDVIKTIDKTYDRVTDAALQKVHMGRAFPEVERADPQVAADLRELAAAPQYYRAKAEKIVQKITQGMTREQEKGFVLLADKDSRDWLRQNKPAEYQSYIHDDRITQALQDYKPYEEDLRDKQKALGGPTIDEDYLRRVYAEHVAGVGGKNAAGETKSVNANRVITPQMANKKGRIASPEYYYNNGLHEFGPSFATRYVATNLKLAEHHAAINFLTKATKIENKDGLPESIEYNGQTYFRADMARAIKEAASDSEEGKKIAADLGITQLPKPSKAQEYSLYDPTPPDKSDFQAKKMAQLYQEATERASGTKLTQQDFEELQRRAAAISYSQHPVYAGPKDIVEAFQKGANHVIPSWIRDLGEILSPVSGMIRRQVIGLGFGVPHIKNILRRVMETSPGAQLDPRSYGRAAKVLLSDELRKRGVKGVDDPAFDALLKHAGISDRGVESYRNYVETNTDASRWQRAWDVVKASKQDYVDFEKKWLQDIKAAYREGGFMGKAKAATTAIAGAVETPLRPMMFLGHHAIFGPGGIDQKSRLWLYDLIKSQDPTITDDQMAQRINSQMGRYNKASWTDFQKDAQPFTFFPGWDYSSVNWVLQHPLRTAIPAALLVLLANQVIHHFGKNKQKDSTDLSRVHYGQYSMSDNIFRERLAAALAGSGLRFASSKMAGKGNEQALRDALSGVPNDAGAFVNMLTPVNPLTIGIELRTGKELGTGHDIVPEGDRKHSGKPEKDYGMYAARKLFPAYTNIASPQEGQTPLTFGLHNLGTSLYKNRRKRH